MKKVVLLTYETDFDRNENQGSVKTWFKSVKRFDWDYSVMGKNQQFRGFGQKVKAIKRKIPGIIKKYGPKTIVIFTDSRDVISNRPSKDFVKVFEKIRKRKPIVFSVEIGCCVYPMIAKAPGAFINRKKGKVGFAILKNNNIKMVNNGKVNHTNKWITGMERNKKLHKRIKMYWMRNLNSGMFCGYAKDLLKLTKILSPIKNKENNQALYTNAMLAFPKLITLDYNNHLFSNANTWDGRAGCFFSYDKKRQMWKNTLTKTYPYFIQVPGIHVDNYNCYHRLTKDLRHRQI